MFIYIFYLFNNTCNKIITLIIKNQNKDKQRKIH